MSSEIGNIMKNALVIKFERHSPTNKELLIMQRTILEFIKSKKRKLYGGAAIHFLLKKKGSINAENREDVAKQTTATDTVDTFIDSKKHNQ